MKRAVRIGSLDLRIFDDGMLKTSLDLLFDIDRTKAAELAGAQPDGSVFIPVNNFLFQRDGATVLIDAGTGRRVDVVQGRTADVAEKWLRGHPGAEVVCRDGSGAYGEAVRQALPGLLFLLLAEHS